MPICGGGLDRTGASASILRSSTGRPSAIAALMTRVAMRVDPASNGAAPPLTQARIASG